MPWKPFKTMDRSGQRRKSFEEWINQEQAWGGQKIKRLHQGKEVVDTLWL